MAKYSDNFLLDKKAELVDATFGCPGFFDKSFKKQFALGVLNYLEVCEDYFDGIKCTESVLDTIDEFENAQQERFALFYMGAQMGRIAENVYGDNKERMIKSLKKQIA